MGGDSGREKRKGINGSPEDCSFPGKGDHGCWPSSFIRQHSTTFAIHSLFGATLLASLEIDGQFCVGFVNLNRDINGVLTLKSSSVEIAHIWQCRKPHSRVES